MTQEQQTTQNFITIKKQLLDLLECEICLHTATDFYVVCKNTHSFCWYCSGKFGDSCPKCREPIQNNHDRDYDRNSNIKTLLHDFSVYLLYNLPMEVDAMDLNGEWCRGFIKQYKREKFLVHYYGWGKKWDDWIHVRSGRLMPVDTYTYDWIENIRIGQSIEFVLIVDEKRVWFVGNVVRILPSGKNMIVKKKEGSWKIQKTIFKVKLNKENITPLGTHTPLS